MTAARDGNRSLRGAVVGAGRMGLTHMAILNMLPGAGVDRICEASKAVAATIAGQLDLVAFTDVDELLDSRPDFVVVATPTFTHAGITAKAIERGIPVFVEKPLALTPEESDGIAARAGAAGVPVMVGYVNRFNPLFEEARAIVAAGLLGDVLHVGNSMLGRTVIRPPRDGWRSEKRSGGGVLREFASHAIDLGLFICPGERRVETAFQRTIHSARVADFVQAGLCSGAGFTETLVVTWSDRATRKPTNEILVHGSAGRLRVSQHELAVFLDREGRTESRSYPAGWTVLYITDLYRPVPFYLRGIEFTRQMEAFVEVVRGTAGGEARSVCDAAQAAAVDRIMAAIEDVAGRHPCAS